MHWAQANSSVKGANFSENKNHQYGNTNKNAVATHLKYQHSLTVKLK